MYNNVFVCIRLYVEYRERVPIRLFVCFHSNNSRHSPSPGRSPSHTPKPASDSKGDENKTRSTGEGGVRGGTADGPPVRQNALLQVSEAHLAILPDEDGDTYVTTHKPKIY